VSPFLLLVVKERKELLRSHRLLIIGVAFALVGLGSPLLAYALPRLLERIPPEELGGTEILLTAPPQVRDALLQFLSNFGLLPLLVVLVSMGALASERRAGTAAAVLSRPVSRRAYVLAKFVVPALVYALGTLIAAAGAWAYTRALFGPVHLPGFALLSALLYLKLLVYLSATLFGSAVAPGPGGAAAIGIGAFALVALLGLAPSLTRISPAGLDAAASDLVLGRVTQPLPAVLASLVVIFLFLALAERLFARRAL
jgi:ABC-2 type transport system permease protein